MLVSPALGQTAATSLPAPATAEAGVNLAGEIIVTAQRRSERLVDVPMSVAALSGETLAKAGVTNTLELAQVTPGLELPMYGAYTQPSIRGISSAGSGLADSSNVATYVDGVYQPSQSGQLADLPNVESVQVLKGPQGALYGQNATGGAIIINTIQPSFTPKGLLSASYGNYDDKAVRGWVTGPITSQLAGALAAAFEDRDGFNRDLLRGGRDKGLRSHQVRGKLLWTPVGETSFTLNAFATKRYDSTPYAGQAYNNVSIATPVAAFFGTPLPTEPHQFAHNLQPDVRIRTAGVSLLGKIPVADIGTVSTVTAYGKVKVTDFQDSDETGVNLAALSDFVVKQHDIIQEVNFLSRKFGGLTVSAGLFYMFNAEKYDPYTFTFYGGAPYPATPPPVATFGNHTQNKRNYYAGYIEGNYELTDALTLTLGGRYSSERQKVYGAALPDPNMYPDPRGGFTFNKFTPRGVVRYKPNEDATVYASVSQGFKSGFVDANAVHPCYDATLGRATQCIPPTDPVRPEVVTAYEVGYKGRLSDAFSFSVAVFHDDYKNIQVFVYRPSTGSQYLNAAKAKIDGVDFDSSFKVSPDLTLGLGAVVLDAKYKRFANAQAFVPYGTLIDGVPLTCADSFPGGNCSVSVDASGARMMRAPKLTLTANVDYEHQLAWGRIGASANLKYNSGFYFDPVEDIKQGRYTLLNAQLFVEPAGLRGVRLSVYGKNLTNKDYLASVLESTVSDAVSYAAPRQYGVQVEYRF
ncbi:TonB-dependent receptor [Phenylobacterium sp. LjRoot225]|uniref:TonB-dependent receptor n=1 Tax=Phenylobacterium sp. LjRoot225 TaxID=3342285 RepID=UPI003ED06F4E